MKNRSDNEHLRFPGFFDEWKKVKLSDIALLYDKQRVPITKKNRINGDTPYYGANGIQDYVKGYTHNGEYVLVAEDGANDINNYPVHHISGKSWVNNHAHVLQGKPNICDTYFIGEYFKHLKMYPYLVGGGRSKLNASILLNIPIHLPSLNEQKRIASLFQVLDDLIMENKEKLERLKEQKRGLLQVMFPNESGLFSPSNFQGLLSKTCMDNVLWKEVRFSELINIRRGLTYKPDDVREFGEDENLVRVLRSSNIQDEQFVLNEDDVFITRDCVNIDFAKNNDILITAANGSSALVGKHAIIQLDNIPSVPGGFMLLGSAKNPYFVNSLMSSTWYKKFINKFVAGGNGAIGNLKKKDLDKTKVFIPPLEEQEKIGCLFKKIDELIKLTMNEIDLLTLQKKGLLQKMFI